MKRLIIGLIIGAVLASASVATADIVTTVWSNARLTSEVIKLKRQNHYQAVRLDNQSARITSANRHALDGIRLANDAYEASVNWTYELMECVELPDGQEAACIDDAIAAEKLPESGYYVDTND